MVIHGYVELHEGLVGASLEAFIIKGTFESNVAENCWVAVESDVKD